MQQDVTFSIGAMATRTSLSVATIRYYEELGLIPAASRRGSGHRFYGTQHESALVLIRNLRALGFPLERIRQVVAVMDAAGGLCEDIRHIAQERLATIRAELVDLQRFERSLAAVIDSCSEACPSGPASKCCITRDLSGSPPPAATPSKPCCGGVRPLVPTTTEQHAMAGPAVSRSEPAAGTTSLRRHGT